ncbi:MAG: hypothetical protein RJA05_904 [Planctomycetota bacterium]
MPVLQSMLRYWHTLRHLKPGQFTARAWHRFHRPRVDRSPAPAMVHPQGQWVAPIARERSVVGDSATFLNVTRDIARAACWNDASIPKLWLYNLHYHEDLLDPDPARRSEQRDFMRRWVIENPPAAGNGWEPYPISLRTVAWIKWSVGAGGLPDDLRQSLAVQVRWLGERIEHHLLANHLFVNAKALAMAGLAFEGPEGDRWLRTGLALLRRELPIQVLPDGGHFELSPMYHALILEDLLDLINAARAWPGRVDQATIDAWMRTAASMLGWLRTMVHPDGGIPFFNDAAFGIAPEASSVVAYAARLGIVPAPARVADVVELPSSGYVRASRGPATILCDTAAIGPDEQPGHAHADTLSFEFSLGDQRVVVNGGTSTYAIGAQRSNERSTRWHSTLEFDGRDSSEVWGGFRVARRARIVARSVGVGPGGAVTIRGAHDGYARLRRGAVHQRTWMLTDARLVIEDSFPHRPSRVRMLLHPSVEPIGASRFRLPDGRALSLHVDGGDAAVEPASWSPGFGRIVPTHCIVIPMQGPSLRIDLSWT